MSTKKVKPDWIPVSPDQVETSGEMKRRMEMALWKNFMVLNLDEDFLDPFRNRCPYHEVERFDRFRGLGMNIHAAVIFASCAKSPKVMARKDYLVSETLKTQSDNGYIGIFEEEVDDEQLWWEWCFHELTSVTKYLRFAADEELGKGVRIVPAALKSWDQKLSPRQKLSAEERERDHNAPRAKGCHMYRISERCLMQLKLHRIEPDDFLTKMSRRLLSGMTRHEKGGMLITGGLGKHEQWHEDQDGTGSIAETCATVYELWWLREMLCIEDDLSYGDFMERALYNALFASQHPDGRQMFYFTPFSGPRTPFVRDAFCCPNNFRRGMASLSGLIYCRADNRLAVNLYAPSRTSIPFDNGVHMIVSQKTNYPASGSVGLVLEPTEPVLFSLHLRIPRWCSQYAITVNGTTVNPKLRAGGIEIRRSWTQGDRVQLDIKMDWRWIKGYETQAGRAALLRGPVIYCLNPHRNPGIEDVILRDITLDPDSVEALENGKCRVRGWRPKSSLNAPPDLDLVFSEFSDPGGEEIYFQLSKPNAAMDDELLIRKEDG